MLERKDGKKEKDQTGVNSEGVLNFTADKTAKCNLGEDGGISLILALFKPDFPLNRRTM